jgi:succinate dehydrogenase / fumarate reductase, cytochrome b subunit
MPASRGVSVLQALRYRGRQGMLAWTLHRLTGLGIVLFVGMHVVAAFFLQQFGDPVATALTALYESWFTQIFVYFCVLYHALNGGRLALMDLFPGLLRYQNELVWLQWAVFTPSFLVPVFFLIRSGLFPS